MSDVERTMFLKLVFINNNKEVLKNNILGKISDSSSVLQAIVLILLDNKSLEECEDYDHLKYFIDQTDEVYTFPSELSQIFSIIKTFINKVCFDDIKAKKIINKIDGYLKLERYIYEGKPKTMQKVI